uniref:Uncharacterized protein n=1 Tax=Oryza meridionalis TaxID=40149 RepID=A0A0E0E957_9ORYZ
MLLSSRIENEKTSFDSFKVGAFLRISAPLSPLRPPPPPSHTVSPLHSLPGNCESIPAGGDLTRCNARASY